MSIRPGGLRRGAGLSLLLAGASLLAVALAGYAQGTVWQEIHLQGDSVFTSDSPFLRGTESTARLHLREGEPFARLTIPKIDLELVVIEGVRNEDLLKAPGHLTDSAVPGEEDNCIIAGHRDRHFRHLGELSPGDSIRLERGGTRADYVVESTQVVSPTRTDLLARTDQAILTLVTCYPFYYVGPAPKRFVVRARLGQVDGPAL